MAKRSHLTVRNVGLAIATVACLGFAGRAAAAPVTHASDVAHPAVLSASMFAKESKALLAQRAGVDVDPIDTNVRHRWPDLTDSASADLTVHAKP